MSPEVNYDNDNPSLEKCQHHTQNGKVPGKLLTDDLHIQGMLILCNTLHNFLNLEKEYSLTGDFCLFYLLYL